MLSMMFLAQLIGPSLLVVSASILTRRESMIPLIETMMQNPPLVFVLGIIHFICGLAIVLTQDPSTGLTLPLVLVLLGWWIIARGVLLIFLSILAPLALGTRSGVRSAAIEQVHAAYSMGATRWQVLTHVILPAALPEILTSMRIGIGFGWTTLVAAEMVAATHGLGYMVLTASQFLQTPIVVLGIVIIAIIAYGFDLLMRWLERRLVPWKGKM